MTWYKGWIISQARLTYLNIADGDKIGSKIRQYGKKVLNLDNIYSGDYLQDKDVVQDNNGMNMDHWILFITLRDENFTLEGDSIVDSGKFSILFSILISGIMHYALHQQTAYKHQQTALHQWHLMASC